MRRTVLFILLSIMFSICIQAATTTAANVQKQATEAISAPAQPVPAASQTQPHRLSTAESARQLMEKVKSVYATFNSYSVSFNMVQLTRPMKNMDESRKKALTDKFDLKYLSTGRNNYEYLMRLSALKGHHKRTVVVYNRDKKGKYCYTVFKPSGKVVVYPEDPRVMDIPFAELHTVIADIDALLSDKDAKIRIEKLDSGIALMISKEAEGKNTLTSFGTKGGIQVSQYRGMRVTSYFDPVTFYLKKQDTEIKTKSEYLFKQSIEWHDFKPNDKIKSGDITAAPVKL